MDEWLSWLNTYNERKINLGLERVDIIANLLNLKKFSCPVIVVGGTNGKGSCVATIESILLAHGKKVGAFTSPHLQRYTERIRINGIEVTVDACCQAFAAIKQAHQVKEIELTYFEITTLAALWLFKRENLDFILLEVGLGGRLDAVNVVEHKFSVITTIGFDHCNYLGNTLEDIAKEKVGIVWPNSILICGDPKPPSTIQNFVKTQNSTAYQINNHFNLEIDPVNSKQWTWKNQHITLENLPTLDFPLANAAVALQTLHLLPNITLEPRIIGNALSQLKVPGRFQKKTIAGIDIFFDVGHNPLAAQWLANKIAIEAKLGKIIIVFGMSREKDEIGTIEPFMELKNIFSWFLYDIKSNAPKPSYLIAKYLQKHKQKFVTINSTICSGIKQALSIAASDDKILVFGSFSIVAEGLAAVNEIN